MIGSIPDSAFDAPQLGTLLEDACPVCSRALEGDVVRCEACYQRTGEGFVCRSCAVPFGGDDRLVTDPADASYWLCTVDYLKETAISGAAWMMTRSGSVRTTGLLPGVSVACVDNRGGRVLYPKTFTSCQHSNLVRHTAESDPRLIEGSALTAEGPISRQDESLERDATKVREVAGRGSGATALQPQFLLAQRPRDDNFSRGAGSSVEAQSAGGGIPGGRRLESGPVLRLKDVTGHHIAQAIVAAALARDLRGGRV